MVLVAACGILAAHRATLDSGADRLAATDGEWLLLACLAPPWPRGRYGTWTTPSPST
ncbi:hypothetical protein [Streptomyces sp. NPDC002088]|uniref:hypothetical protein n=1 Tax=Streptomyces sp. NPDC002088 TaxID=3154665 RepID=UPI0033263979